MIWKKNNSHTNRSFENGNGDWPNKEHGRHVKEQKKILYIHLKKSLKKYIIQSFILFGEADQ